ncbi:glycosyltransferase family 2 protein [Parapedobacter tibetensis]|uniref:glycosyltransferase family 2 protein n=1 Tax=Parapedobacter tibetensis TaxID=2972951 RepID=UPI00214D5963|nr:glycosyltransferase family 2 protein [Parapedobacter tibetensis]
MSSTNNLERGMSVILCTHNGAKNLPDTLRHLAAQQLPATIPWELVFVDNASTDESTTIAQAEWTKFGGLSSRLVHLREGRSGKYYALQAAMKRARYAYFVICDDDNWLAPDYLYKTVALLDAHPEVGAVGGQGIPVTEENQPLPEWFDRYQEGYAVGPQGKQTGDVTYKGHLWGAGLGSRTALYRAIYNKYPSFLLQLNNLSLMSTEDSEYCLRLVLRGYKLYYDDTLVYRHLIPSRKLTGSFIDDLYKRHHASYAVNGKYFLAMKIYRGGLLQKRELWGIRLSGFIGSLLAQSFKRKIRARAKWGFLRCKYGWEDVVGWGIVDLLRDEQLPKHR